MSQLLFFFKKIILLQKRLLMNQPKIERVLRLMQYLTGNVYYTIEDLSLKLGMSRRTIYRYLDTFKSVGYVLQRINDGVYRMEKMRNNIDLRKTVYFSEEEAYVVSNLIDRLDNTNAMKQGLKRKLAAVYDATNLAKYIDNKGNSDAIQALSRAMRDKQIVVLRRYSSSHSQQVKDYEVEPFKFNTNYESIWAFDTKAGLNKRFKVARIGEVERLETKWKYESQHQEEPMDSFRSHSKEVFHVKLQLDARAKNLLVEEYPLAEREVFQDKEGVWYYEGDVRSMEGVGRFVLRLPEQITILEGEEVKRFVREKALFILSNY